MPKLLTQGVSLEPKNGRQLIGIVAGFKSERWPVIDRNAGRLQLGIRTLAALDGSPKVHLHSDDFWHFIKHGAIQPYLSEAHRQNEVVLDVLANVAAGYARGGYFVIVDGIVGPWFLEAFDPIGFPIHYIVLRPSLETAIKRCRLRGGNTLSDPEPIAALHQQFSALGPLERHVLSTADDDRESLLMRVITALDSEAYRLTRQPPAAI